MPVLEPDSSLRLPSVTVLKASAGSGKTYTLTERYVQFLLSPRVPHNALRNLLAITFSNNASGEMRREVLGWLKRLHLGEPARLAEMSAVTTGGAERAAARAGTLIEEILSRWSDFQVKTIDSFMATVFRASAIDFGFSPEFEILMEPAPLVEYAFNIFLREAREGSDAAAFLDDTVRTVLGFKGSDDAFPWDPAAPLLEEITKIERRLTAIDVRPSLTEIEPVLREHERRIRRSLERVAELLAASGLEPHGGSTFARALASARTGRMTDLITAGMKNGPVKKPRAKDSAGQAAYDRIEEAWVAADAAVNDYTACWARAYFQPYLRIHAQLASTAEIVKRRQGKVAIGDIGRTLAKHLSAAIVPDIYFRIGERVWHFLVDEFQDTSPLQWRNLSPLVENSLAVGGSLFVVGDTKQAIYGFRDADYRIMRDMETASPFPSARLIVRQLGESRRSAQRVLDFVSEVFLRNAPANPLYREAAHRSGLDAWEQKALPQNGDGYAEVEILERDDDDPPERRRLQSLVQELHARGYGWGDLAILATRNQHIIHATSWLNELGIPFISFSSLDVRTRPVAAEIFALLSFLDSPPDDLAFASFLQGGIFARALSEDGRHGPAELHDFLFRCRTDRPLYKAFQREFPDLWKECFAALFRSAGYLPLYDLLSDAYARFAVFTRAAEEEATLAKLLEAVKELEGAGANSLRDFLGQAADEGGKWSIDVPASAQSVRAMTVHKAKGLGFPVVITLLYGEANRGFESTIFQEGDDAALVKITRRIAERDPSLSELYQEEEVKAKVNRLNGLYVALTRAKRELYVIGVKAERDVYPFDLLPASGFAPGGQKGAAVPDKAAEEVPSPLSHAVRTVPLSFGSGILGREERTRGELAHRVLELVEYAEADPLPVLENAAERAAREMRGDPAGARIVAKLLADMITATELGALFARAPGRIVLREQEVCDREGRLFRMDRIVVDPSRVAVIDFKTGAEEPRQHASQVRGYREILQGVYPDAAIDALVAYVDLGIVRRVE